MSRNPRESSRYIHIIGKVAFVELTQGKTAIIDADDAPLVSGCLWRAHQDSGVWYAVTGRRSSQRFMHRVLLCPEDGSVVDHKDGDGLNNRRSNIRVCTIAENLRNSKKREVEGVEPASQFKGVTKGRSGWRASIRIHGVITHLGNYSTEELAARAYDMAAREHFGEFARPNFKERAA